MNRVERIIKVIEYSKCKSPTSFAQLICFNQSNLSKILNGKRDVNNNLIDAICNKFPEINRAWLTVEDEDKMFKQANEALPRAMDVVVGVPLVSQYAYAGYLTGFGDPEYIDTLPKIDFTPERHMTGNYVAFEVKGDSMNDGSADSYLEGELLICREVEPIYWKDSKLFINKRDFVIIHKEGILIKRIITHDVENHKITIHSLNPLYPDEVLDLADVRQIFSVVESRRQRRR